ncbi:MAG: hypothetical protein ACTS5I_02025 [Rhodanobacter sp.]
MRGWHYLALAAALSLLAGPTFASKADRQQAAASHKADLARDAALLAFQRDLVNVLAPQADALPLLAAALLARPLPQQPKYHTFHSLIERAAQADNAGPAIQWERLADCDAKADACPNTDALTQLQQHAPDNAAVWLLKLGMDQAHMKFSDARADLGRAANAKLYDDYAGIGLKALASTVSTLPPPADTMAPGSTAGANAVQWMMTLGTAQTRPQINLPSTAKMCANPGDDAELKGDCLKLGKLLEWGSSPLARSLGLHLRETLAEDPAQQAEARSARINLIWQVQNFASLTARAQNDTALARGLLALARSGGTEMSLMLAALRHNGIAVDAPTGWQPHKAD